MQLLEPEHGLAVQRVISLGHRIRDGLLRDNKVIPAVLGVLALLVFAWLIAGALIGGPGDEEGKQASNQASLAPEDSKTGDSGTPAPEAENRDTESFAAFKPKDPFRQLIPKASETTNESTTSSKSGGSTSKSSGTSSKGGGGFIDQTFPGSPGGRTDGGARSGGEGTSSAGGGAGRSGGDLFNSGGDLPAP